ncbi:MAG: glycosyltransferase, partial [Deltaproteobacteria bacterium]
MEIGFVFTNYNNSAYSILSIESLATTPAWRDCRVVIVDNASQEKDLNLLAQLSESHPEIDVIYNDSNLGYFSGLNVGIEFIRNK